MVVVVHVDDVFAHAEDQTIMERFAAELGRKLKLKNMGDVKYFMRCHITRERKVRELKLDQYFYVKSMVETFGIEKASRIPSSSGVSTFSQAVESQTPEEKEEMSKFSKPGGSGSAHVDGNDDTAGDCMRSTRCGQVR